MDPTTKPEYNPYQWPPDMLIAHLHARCSMPGKQNPDGEECPCCSRREKLRTTNWFKRNLYKDFKYYGGGVSGYFGLLAYYGFATIILILLITIYHMICVEYACTEEAIRTFKCVRLFTVIKIMSPEEIKKMLLALDHPLMVDALNLVYFLAFVFLLMINFATMNHLGMVEQKLTKSVKIFSHFSLIFKNIPRYMNLVQFKNSLIELYPEVRIKETFFLHKTARYYQTHKRLMETYYQLQYYRMNERVEELAKLQPRFIELAEQLDVLKLKYLRSSGKAIVVFQQQSHKDFFAKEFHMPSFKLVTYHICKLLKFQSTNEMGMYADAIAQPGQIIWKYIGDSSVAKTKVRIETGVISIVFLLICAGIIFEPMERANTTSKPVMVVVWNIVSACGLFILNLIYRYIVSILADQRKPNTYLSKSFFAVVTTVFFHLLFYLYLPAVYYAISSTKSSASVKLRTLFFQVTVFVIVSIIIASIDVDYCMFRTKMKKHLSDIQTSYKFCQKQLHQKLNYPSFPIEFKLMIMYKIWSFIVFYTFQIPEVLFLILILMVFLYFGDKFRVYNRYKMSTYLPIQLEKNFERTYIYVYIVTLCLSYLITATETWQFCIAPFLAVSMIALRLFMDYRNKKRESEEEEFQKSETLSNVLKTYSQVETIRQQLFDSDSQRMSVTTERQQQSMSLKTINAFTSGYKSMYQSFVSHLSNKKINEMLDNQYKALKMKHCPTMPRSESEMTDITKT